VLKTELYSKDIPDTYRRFAATMGHKHWLIQKKKIQERIKGHPELKEYLWEENQIVLSLCQYEALFRRPHYTPGELENKLLYPAITFAAQTLSIMDSVKDSEKHKLIRRIHGAIKNPNDLRALELEIQVATHFTTLGYNVIWPEIEGCKETYDLLIEGIGDKGLEVECKSISKDKGLKIHQLERLEFYAILKKEISDFVTRLEKSLTVVLTLPDRMPRDFIQRRSMIRQIRQQIFLGEDHAYENGIRIRIGTLDSARLPECARTGKNTFTMEDIREFTGTENQGAMIYANKAGGGMIFTVQSQKDDTLLPSIFKTLTKSAKKQLTGDRPAIFCVGLHGISIQDLSEIVRQDQEIGQQPTALRKSVSEYLNKNNQDHVVGVNFLVKNGTRELQENLDSISGGKTYNFSKNESPYWHKDFEALFKL